MSFTQDLPSTTYNSIWTDLINDPAPSHCRPSTPISQGVD